MTRSRERGSEFCTEIQHNYSYSNTHFGYSCKPDVVPSTSGVTGIEAVDSVWTHDLSVSEAEHFLVALQLKIRKFLVP